MEEPSELVFIRTYERCKWVELLAPDVWVGKCSDDFADIIVRRESMGGLLKYISSQWRPLGVGGLLAFSAANTSPISPRCTHCHESCVGKGLVTFSNWTVRVLRLLLSHWCRFIKVRNLGVGNIVGIEKSLFFV